MMLRDGGVMSVTPLMAILAAAVMSDELMMSGDERARCYALTPR